MIVSGLLILALIVFFRSPHTESTEPSAAAVAEHPEAAIPESAPSTQETAAVPETPEERSVGEEVSTGYWTYQCHGYKWTKMWASKYNDVKIADAQFLVIDVSVRNDDKTASTLVVPKLVDSSGREYKLTPNTYDAYNSFDTLKELNPGVSSRGYFVFDVPPGQYFLQVSGGFESGKFARIRLFDDVSSTVGSPKASTSPPATGDAGATEGKPGDKSDETTQAAPR